MKASISILVFHITEQGIFYDIETHPVMPWTFIINVKWKKGVCQFIYW